MKHRLICVIALCIIILLTACQQSTSQTNTESVSVVEDLPALAHEVDNTKPLQEITKKYDLEELRAFFAGHSTGELEKWSDDSAGEGPLYFSEVNEVYPVEIIRTREPFGGYSVFEVLQGGYYYVFWAVPASDEDAVDNWLVCFSTYIYTDRSQTMFDSLIPGVSTAADVKAVDPYVELDFELTSGICSYSYLNPDTIMYIEYIHPQRPIDSPTDLVIKKIEVRAKFSNYVGASYITDILPGDYPTNRR